MNPQCRQRFFYEYFVSTHVDHPRDVTDDPLRGISETTVPTINTINMSRARVSQAMPTFDADIETGADVTSYYNQLIRFVRNRLRRRDEAADVVQDAYVRLALAAQRSEIRNASAFLHVATRNLVHDRVRSAIVRRAPEVSTTDVADIPCSAPSAERVLIGQQRVAALEQALRELPLKRRAALVLYRFDNLSHAQIAERLGISISMVEKHIRFGLAHCRKRLEDMEGGPIQ